MKVVSLNIAKPTTIVVNRKKAQTGYFKKAVKTPIYLGKIGVKDDCVSDHVHHGGQDKACYIYGVNNYDFWKKKHPNVMFDFGLFGENITVDLLNEAELKIGTIFQLGEAKIQISQPRQPCYKMGVRFNNQKVVKQFRLAAFPGIYVRVLEEGFVRKGAILKVIESPENELTVLEIYRLIYSEKPSKNELIKAVQSKFLAENLKKYIINKFEL